MFIQKVYKYKLRPTTAQQQLFRRWLGCCRFVYNLCLEHRLCHWQSAQVTLSEYEQVKALTQAKKTPGFEWLSEVHSQVLQDVVRRVRLSFDHFFRGAGFPRWASRHSWCSFRYPQAHHGSIRIEGNRIRLPKIGWVKMYYHRPCQGRIKQVTIKKQPEGYFVCISVEQSNQALPARENQTVGIDLGIARLATLSNGKVYANPRLYERFGPEVKRLQRKLSRQINGSRSWRKTKARLGRLHAKISRCRRDYLHKVSTEIIGSYAGIIVEDLRIANMTKSAKGTLEHPGRRVRQKSGLNRSLLDVSPGMLLWMLEYKSQWHERHFERVNPRYTSQRCSECGHTDSCNRRSQAVFRCNHCDHATHADLNASKNIRDLGQVSGSQYGQVSRALPVSA